MDGREWVSGGEEAGSWRAFRNLSETRRGGGELRGPARRFHTVTPRLPMFPSASLVLFSTSVPPHSHSPLLSPRTPCCTLLYFPMPLTQHFETMPHSSAQAVCLARPSLCDVVGILAGAISLLVCVLMVFACV